MVAVLPRESNFLGLLPRFSAESTITMDRFKQIKEEIMLDPSNLSFTEQGIEPLFQGNVEARLVIVGQAPGKRAQETQLFWNDLSGDRLREWMGLSREQFYHSNRIAHQPMDFYYPGKAKTGDLPPRSSFAETWHPRLLQEMPHVETIICIGAYAQKYYLADRRERNLTEIVRAYEQYLPEYFPLVHPSPLNQRWIKRNPWFTSEVLPSLKTIVAHALIER